MSTEVVRRQHTGAIFIGSLRTIITVAVYIAGYALLSGGDPLTSIMVLSSSYFAFVLIGYSLVQGFLNWYFFRYRLSEDGTLFISSGIIVKRKRNINRSKVQLVDIEAGFLQQLLGLVSLKIETSGGAGKAEASFSALSRETADEIKSFLGRGEEAIEDQNDFENTIAVQKDEFTITPSISELFAFAASSGKMAYVLVIAYAISEQLPPERITYFLKLAEELLTETSGDIVLIALLGLFLTSWLLTTIVEMVTYASFSAKRSSNDVLVQYGLFQKKSYHIPCNQIRAILLKENILRQLLGLVSVYVEINCGREKKNQQEVKLLLPVVRKEKLLANLKQMLPQTPLMSEEFETPPLRSVHRYLLKPVLLGLLTAFVARYTLFESVRLEPFMGLAAGWTCLFGVRGYMAWRYSGIAFTNDAITIRRGGMNLATTLIPRNTILGLECKSHPLERLARVCSISVILPSGTGARIFAHGANETSERAFTWFSRSSA